MREIYKYKKVRYDIERILKYMFISVVCVFILVAIILLININSQISSLKEEVELLSYENATIEKLLEDRMDELESNQEKNVQEIKDVVDRIKEDDDHEEKSANSLVADEEEDKMDEQENKYNNYD